MRAGRGHPNLTFLFLRGSGHGLHHTQVMRSRSLPGAELPNSTDLQQVYLFTMVNGVHASASMPENARELGHSCKRTVRRTLLHCKRRPGGMFPNMKPKSPKIETLGRLVGYARVSTEKQGTDPQLAKLRAAGCHAVHEEYASGADRGRPVLAGLLRAIAPGETLVVVRLDRLARSVSHLLAVIEQLEASGAHFRSLRDPIDTSTPQGMFSLQVLGAVAQLERALISERTKAGLSTARARGRVGGNPGLRVGDPDAIRKLRASRDAGHLQGVLAPGCLASSGSPDAPRPAMGRCRAGAKQRARLKLDSRAASADGEASGR